MNIAVIFDDQVLQVEVDKNALISDIITLVSSHRAAPFGSLYILKDSSKIPLDPKEKVTSYGKVEEIYVDRFRTDSAEFVEALDSLKVYYISQAIEACTNNNIESLQAVISEYGHIRTSGLTINDTLDIINSLYQGRWNCLHYASYAGHNEIIRELLELGANVNICTSDNWTALQLAVHQGHPTAVQLLLSHPLIQVNKNTKERGTALHVAAAQGNPKIVELLLAHNANVSIENKEKKIAKELASNDLVFNILSQISAQCKEKPASFSGIVSFASEYLIHDANVFLVLNAEEGLFYHFSTREDFVFDRAPEFKTAIVNITSVRTSSMRTKFFFIVECPKNSLHYFTSYPEMTEVWTELLLDSIKYFQDMSNNRHFPGVSNKSSILSSLKYSQLEENACDTETAVSLQSFEVITEIGKGSFGSVSLAKKKNSGGYYALKTMHKAVLKHSKQLKYAISECRILKEINHPFIVKLHWAFQTRHKLFMVMEYCQNGDLGRLLTQYKQLSSETARFYIAQVVLAIEYLHKNDIVYRDLKPSNILIEKHGYIKLADFGLAVKNISESNPAMTFCGSPAYLAPEILSSGGAWKATDVYDIGVMLYELLVGIPPFYTEQIGVLYARIQNDPVSFPEFVGEFEREMITAVMKKDPVERPSINMLKSAKYFEGLDWNALELKVLNPPIDMEEFQSSKFYSSLPSS